MMLRVDGVVTDYGHVRVLRDFSLGVDVGEIVGLLGRNGAGKTTALKTIMGLVRPKRGSIVLDGADSPALPPIRCRSTASPTCRRVAACSVT